MYKRQDIMIGFNPKFFIDALRVIDEEEVNLYMVNPKAVSYTHLDVYKRQSQPFEGSL